jgi:tetratricopeptide (TPR) repeat protein
VETVPNQTRNMAAYDLYLKGRAALRQRSPEAKSFLEQAIDADPNFAPAYAALAIALNATFDDNDRAVVLADRALALDPDNVDALNAKAAALRSRMQWAESEAVFERALAIDPNSAELLEDWAEFLAYVGRVEEALDVAARGVDIDAALMPLQAAYVEALLSTGRPEDAKAVVMDLANDSETRLFAWYVGVDVWLDPRFMEEGATPSISFEAMEGVPDTWSVAAEFVNQYLRPGTGPDLSDDAIAELKAVYGAGLIEDRLFINTVARSLLIAAGEIDHVLAADLSLFDTTELALHELQWVPAKAALRAHPDFGAYLEKANLLAYWDANGWPEFCQRIEGEVKCQ